MKKDRNYRIGFVGAGNVSNLHLKGIDRHPEKYKIVAVCDPDEHNRQNRVDEYAIDHSFVNVEEMITSIEIDAAVVCAPTQIRKEVMLPLIEAGIPIFCEKPFAETFSEAKEIQEAASKAGVQVAINQNHRRFFTFIMARDLLKNGALGKPLHLTQVANGLRYDVGWRLDRKRYIMAVMSIHWVDGYRLLFQKEPETVYCRNVNSPATPGGEDTAVSMVLEFPG
jgi:predicted dehydrogenase